MPREPLAPVLEGRLPLGLQGATDAGRGRRCGLSLAGLQDGEGWKGKGRGGPISTRSAPSLCCCVWPETQRSPRILNSSLASQILRKVYLL